MSLKAAILAAQGGMMLAACSTATPIAQTGPAPICIIESPRSKPARAAEEYRAALEARGFEAKLLPAGSGVGACPLTSKYLVSWGRDIGAEFITSVHLDVFKDGLHAGHAVWRTRVPTAMTSEQVLNELVDKLYPR